MGRYTGPACKQCRREGMKLFLKGDRCYMAKCPIEQGHPAPGMHGQRRSKLSDYGVQLREKQKLRRTYGMQESQFRLFFQRALKTRGITGEKLLQLLEMRLDNLVYRLGFAPSRRAARQFVQHGHILVNGKKASIPSMVLKAGDVVAVKNQEHSRAYAGPHIEQGESRGLAPWLALDKSAFEGRIVHVPSRDEISPTVNEQLIVELYSK
ncbi:MAG TPA: 30S ribosomal protein S4 [Kiritimatiellia bacterium]|nr:30S ribosomal protein S4 [Kiritimatiellia bacterium]HMO98847.1 30S ribosomal protein S4 [Kiritimatiellia bacterium]HMP96206.1 30S ribosomal protein S4 [Kiritimatiellia bacterium]